MESIVNAETIASKGIDEPNLDANRISIESKTAELSSILS